MGALWIVHFCLWGALLFDFGGAFLIGDEFVTTFMQNGPPNVSNQNKDLRISGTKDKTNVTIEVLGGVYLKTISLSSKTTVSVTLPEIVEIRGNVNFKTVVYVTSDAPISVLSMNSRYQSAETSVVYPLSALGTEYYLMTPKTGASGTSKVFSVIAAKEDASVEIHTKGSVQVNGERHAANSVFSIMLPALHGVQVLSPDDMTGSKIVSTKPVVVLSGHTCAQKNTNCNHVYEQLLPVSSWGKSFIAIPLSFQQNTDLVYIVAASKTEVNYFLDATQKKENMVAGQVLEIELSKTPLRIEASQPVQVTFFNTGGRGRRYEYDPFLMNIVDRDSYCSSYYLYGQRGIDNYAIIVAESSSIADIRFDGRPINQLKWAEIPGTDYHFLEHNYGNSLTSHRVEHPSKAFGLQSVGIGSTFSYGSPGTCVKESGPSCRDILCHPRKVCVMESRKPICVKPQVDLCWASGDPHFRTWDKKYFDFMGTCTYTFATVCGDVGDLPKFTVQIKNDNRGNVRVSYVGQVTLLSGPHTITIKKGEIGRVRVDNALRQLPISLLNGTLGLFQSGNAVIVQLGNDVQLLYDWNHYLLMELTRRYAGKMCGMCGNYNQDPADDFQTPDTTVAPNAIAFGSSWKVEDSTVCWNDCRGPCLSCPPSSAAKYSSVEYCGLISKDDGPFTDCHAVVDPKMYLENCAFDVCVNGGFKKIFCDAVQAYADTCQRAGVAIKDWRQVAGCPLQCPDNSSYQLCGDGCPANCEHPEGSPDCSLPCVETCQCNPGFVLSEGKCMPKSSCGCSYNGFTHAPNQAFWNDNTCQQRCVCNQKTLKVECTNSPCGSNEECAVKNGILNCYPRSYGVCTASGDPHYFSFDGRSFDFQGTCTYQLTALRDKNRGLTDFEIWVRNQNRGNIKVSYTTEVHIKAYGLEIAASRRHPNKVMINKILRNLPFRFPNGQLSIYRNPCAVVFIFDFGVKVTYDYNSVVRVSVSGTYANALGGLCGNFNGLPGDDLTPKDGTRPVDPTTFGKSWKVGDVHGCRDDGSAVCPELSSEEKRQKDGGTECGVLVSPSGPFRDCHSLEDPLPYFQSCVYDYCALQKRQSVFCSVMTSYVMACQEAGGTVHPWRSQNFCPFSCPAHSSYEVCADSCPVTCNGLSAPEGCDGSCTEGCACNNGFLLSGGQCVPISECGCNYNEGYYSVGESVFVGESCSQKCSCTEGGIMTCVPSHCSPNDECKIQNGVLGCFPRGSDTCTAAGYSHYRTFDNKSYDFGGHCSYILAQSCGDNTARGNLTAFQVTINHEKQDSSPGKIRSVTIEAYQKSLTLNYREKGVIQVNGVMSKLPVTLLSGKIRAECYGQGVMVKTVFDLAVKYDLQSRLSVTVPSSYMDGMCGLCGNYNGLAEDDAGTTPEEINAFGRKWKAQGEPEQTCDGCGGSDNPCPSCQEEKKKIFLQTINCGIISDPTGPFAKCHSKVNPESYVNDCVSDLCQTNGEDSSVLCDSVAVYADACKYEGVKDITWRKEDFCPVKCGPHSHYVICADMCSTTCASIYDIFECSDLCDEGCECDDGYVFDGQNCIPLDQCGCFDNGRYYQAHEIELNDDCSVECTCNPISGLSCKNTSCAEGEKCQIVDGVRSCVNLDPCKSKTCRAKEECHLQNGQPYCKPAYTGTCWAWGDPHFGTFDGLNFDFQGTCSYVLSKYVGDDSTLEPFQVVIKNDNRGSQAVSYVKRTEVQVYGTNISIETGEFPKIRVNDELTNLPAILADGKLKVTLSGLTGSIEADFGLVVTSDWNWHATVTLPSSYYSAVSGLCGNFNQDPNDDRKSPDGTLVNSIVDWGSSWKVHDQDSFCFDSCQGQCPTFDEAKKQQYVNDKSCGLIMKEDGPFQGCFSKENPNKFYDACLFDVSMTDGSKTILCQSLETYASACLTQGVKLLDWRTPSDCPKICEDKNSQYAACGNACPASCFDRNAPGKCTKPCVEACECKEGMVLSGDKCVPISSCGCQYNGRYYDPDQSWYNEKCNVQCQCDSALGIVVCKETKCKESETCMMSNGVRGCYPSRYTMCIASGDPHYITFDKRKIDFMGTCIYQLVGVTSQDPSLPKFTVKVQNDHRGNEAVSFTKDVILEVNNTTITMSKDHPKKIKVNGLIVDLPYYSKSSMFMAFISGNDVVLKTSFELLLTFDGWSFVRVILPITYKGAVDGLCGNSNGDPGDDFNTQDGEKAMSPEEFGKRWKVGDVEGCEKICSDCPKCTEVEREPYKSDQFCGLLIQPDGPFSQCHQSIDPNPFFDACIFDACAYKGHQSIVCDNIVSYVSECQRSGSMVKEWRTPSFCELICPPNSHYNLLGDGCPVTCLGLISPPTCEKSSTEGCYCDDGFVLSGDDCVPIAECGCTYENVYHKTGQEFFTDDLCQKKCTCGNNGITTCHDHSCGANEECKVVDGDLGCHAKELGQCIAWGDPHYITFDNVYYDMQGICRYTLVRVKKANFEVTVENEPYGNVAVTKSVTVTIGDHIIHLGRGGTWTIEVNEERYNVPCKSQKREYWINQEGNNVIVQTKQGFKVLFDQQYFVSIWAPSSFVGLTEGLCGNYNKNSGDDFRLPNGSIVTDFALFTESWTVTKPGLACRGCSGSQCPTCSEAASTEANSPTKCGIITDPQGPFKDCHALVPPERFGKSCVFDVCAGRGGQEALCASLQAYTALCQEKEAKVQPWREVVGCPFTCPASSHYSQCTETCGVTCYGLLAPTTCTNRCFEGCECDPGFVFDGNNCVAINHCGCLHNGRYLKANESVRNEDCSQECTCDPKLGLTCHHWTCDTDEKCQLLDGVRSCVSTDPCKVKTCRLKETCKVEDDKPVCVPDYNGLCWAWGDPHFRTFDEKDFNFQGTCSYVLAKYSGDDPTLEPFQVIIKSDNRGSQAASFVRRMEITIYNIKISAQVGEFPKIRIDDELTNLPVSLANGKLKVHRSGLTAIIEAISGITATFDWNWHVTLTIPSSYHNGVSGLCGNFNQDPNDDQQSPDGNIVNATTEWGSSWKVYDRDPFCFDSCPGYCPTCDENKKKLYGGNDYCGVLFKKDGPFRDCIPIVSPEKFFDACLFDVCMNDGARNILCQTLETYASTCQNQAMKIFDWRTPSGCPKLCADKNSHYNACGNACPASCSDRNAPAICSKPCVETCECNENMVLSGNSCVPISSCGCQYNGRYYEPKETWSNEKCSVICNCDPILGIMSCQDTSCKDGETCMVVHGKRGCHPTEYSTCVVSGDPHYLTFDGRRFPYMGSCIYQLVKVASNDPSLVQFQITVQNENRGTKAVSFTKEVTLMVHNTTITMSKDHPQQIKVNGRLTNLPYYHYDELTLQIAGYISGSSVTVTTDFDLTILFDGWNYLRVVLPSTYEGAVSGLCGNNNGDPSDDFTTGDGRIVSSPEEFGEHWKVEDVDGCAGECPDCPKCNDADKEVYRGDQYCGLLLKSDGPFSECHESVDPTPFFEDCVFDACAYKGHQSVVCASLSNYVSECHRNGSLVKEWRTISFCKWNCPSNSHYELSGNGCPSTCYGQKSPLVCEKSPTEGCYCDNGYIRSGQDCVKVTECGCVFENAYYKLGQEFFIDDQCHKKCRCESNGITTCQDHSCGANEECKVKDGILSCQAKEHGQCIAWGDPHYVTFDGVYYDMQGTCRYTLVRVNSSQGIFEVAVENEPYGNVAVTKSVRVTMGNHIIHLERGRTWMIEVNRVHYHVPFRSQNQDYWINQEGNNVIVQTKNGFTVLYDQQYFVSVTAPSSYAGLTEGLCGNYNEDSSDDFRLPNGNIVTDLSLFAESWTVARDGSTCRGCSGSQCPTCSEAASTEANSPTKCGMIADPQGPFKDCHALVPPQRYTESCVFDNCAGHGHQESLCASLQAYTALCQEKGAKVQPWREVANCPLSCRANAHYEPCTRTCDFTCSSLLAPSTCSDRCYEGCQCDAGYVFDGEKCVTMDKCGCTHNGRYLKEGESVLTEDCGATCTCTSGVVSCSMVDCATPFCQTRDGVRRCQTHGAQCTLRADHKFITFDGISGQFPTEGSFVMSSSCSKDEKDQFMVVVEIKKCSRSKEGRSLQIFTPQGLISVSRQQEIWLNGWELEAPGNLGNGSVMIQKSQSGTTVELRDQITVIFTKTGEIQIIPKDQAFNNLCGPCGNFNRAADDDLLLKTGEVSADVSFTVRSWVAKHLSPCFS